MPVCARFPRRLCVPPVSAGSAAGYILLEALTALAILGIGVLPLSALAPGALQWWRQQGALAHAVRIAAEAAELTALAGGSVPPLPAVLQLASLRDARGLPPPRWCLAVPRDVAAQTCPPGPRVVLVGPLPAPARQPRAIGSSAAALRAVALWVRP